MITSYRLEIQLCLPANVRIRIERGLNAAPQTGSIHVEDCSASGALGANVDARLVGIRLLRAVVLVTRKSLSGNDLHTAKISASVCAVSLLEVQSFGLRIRMHAKRLVVDNRFGGGMSGEKHHECIIDCFNKPESSRMLP